MEVAWPHSKNERRSSRGPCATSNISSTSALRPRLAAIAEIDRPIAECLSNLAAEPHQLHAKRKNAARDYAVPSGRQATLLCCVMITSLEPLVTNFGGNILMSPFVCSGELVRSLCHAVLSYFNFWCVIARCNSYMSLHGVILTCHCTL